ncbi:hypothetical protein CTAM01_16837 [Colletotrichum tamarilloi]|uniref:tyrosinase n=1 Tax=Colletotrichum tamarilloi TaxID=1209934 RepID=A0ABQ9QHC9_9PEZI|nr:uncharacterized protein CTAM01_16837 [Colletotrichum tamarilloi]KAK1470386.1 hypothetical protein CTAM01_16837 [Colletotrichum tamarilloi]
MSSDGTKGPVIIKGIQDGFEGKERPLRLELRDMIKENPDQWNLYLLGLERFQAVPEDQPLSYFQIAGIHGMPSHKWPNEKWNYAADENLNLNKYGGYCTHTSLLFLTWHRPYLALFEASVSSAHNELYKHVNYIAKEFEKGGVTKYIDAAKTFRMPYWDWARPGLPLFPDEAISRARHPVKRPPSQSGLPEKINPLGSYKFGEYSKERTKAKDTNFIGIIKNDSIDKPAKTARTFGQRADDEEPDIEDVKIFTKPNFGVKGMNVSERVLFLLQSYTDFAAVSNNGEFGPVKGTFDGWGSLEDVHNAVHNYIGGGYMGRVAFSAFDPIFWLHHTNIDRLFAIWQVCNPGEYVKQVEGSDDNVETPLTPFTRSVDANGQQTFWTSAGVEDTRGFGYIYPETQSAFGSRKAILNEVDRIYWKRASFANILRSQATQPPDLQAVEALRDRARAHLKAAGRGTELPVGRDIRGLAVGDKYLEWLVNIRTLKSELHGNYIVNVFIGEPSESTPPLLYMKDHAHVGSFATFGQDEESPCAKCKKDRSKNQEITGQIPLTIALVERYMAGLLDSLKPEHVVGYLKDNIRWKITLPTGELQSPDKAKSLIVCVVSNEVTFKSDKPGELPVYSDVVTAYSEITRDIPGSGESGYDGNNY